MVGHLVMQVMFNQLVKVLESGVLFAMLTEISDERLDFVVERQI